MSIFFDLCYNYINTGRLFLFNSRRYKMEVFIMCFSVGDYVMYGSSGVCRISGVEKRNFDGQHETDYISLVPVSSASSKYYIPQKNSDSKIRSLLTKEQINQLIDEIPDTAATWFSDSHERKNAFASIIKSDDYKQIISMIKALHIHKELKNSGGKKLNSSDENFMHRAENLMYQEFSVVLGIPQDNVVDYISKRINH